MIRVALEGLLGRKLRTALTAIAIVLGVAMVCGTFVLTDSIDNAFDSIFTEVRQGSNVVVSGKSAFDLATRAATTAPTLDETLLDEGARAARRRGGRRERRRRGAADRQERQGDRLRRRAEPRLQHRERRLAVQSAHPRRGRVAAGGRGRHRQVDRRQGALRGRRQRSGCRPRGRSSGCGSRGSSSSARCRRSAARRSQGSTCRPPSSCSTSRAARRDRDRREARRLRRAAV